MAGAFTFEDLIFSCVYLIAVIAAGKLFALTGGTPLVGEIVMGMILGPYLLDILGHFSSSFMLAGEMGLLLLVLEAGLDVDLDMLKMVGPMGVAVAFFGSALPLGMGFGISYAYGYGIKECAACAAALAPTSMGIAINVLKSGKVLDTPTGQLIIAAAVVDDVIALVLLSELRALNDPTALNFAIPIVAAVVSLVAGMLIAIFVVPRITRVVMPRIPEAKRGNIVLSACFILALLFMVVCNYARASYLLGCFLAGVCFCTVHELHHAWKDQVKRIMYLLLHIFFSATIGFEIPITELWTGQTILRMLGYVACMLGKVATGVFAKPFTIIDFLTIGFAMSAWGEFAFLVANESYRDGIINKEQFMPLAFAILMSAILAPFGLKFTLDFRTKKQLAALAIQTERAQKHRESVANAHFGEVVPDEHAFVPVYYKMHMRAVSGWGVIGQLFNAAGNCKLEIIETRVTSRDGIALHVMFFSDNLVELPLLCPKGSTEAEALKNRVREIHDAFAKCLGSNDLISLSVARWHPHLLGLGDDIEAALLKEMEAEYGKDIAQLEVIGGRASIMRSIGSASEDGEGNMIVEGYKTTRHEGTQEILYDNNEIEDLFRQDVKDISEGRRLSQFGEIALQEVLGGDDSKPGESTAALIR